MSCRGMTLLEVVIVALIMTLASGAVLVLAQAGYQTWANVDSRLENLTNAQLALNRLTTDLRTACQSTLTTCSVGQLTFKISPACQAVDPTVTYALSGNRLTRQGGAASPATIASGVTAFVPSCILSNAVVSLSLTTRTSNIRVPPDAQTQTLISQVRVENL